MANVTKVSTLSERLSQLLEQEFVALQAKTFDEVEELQNTKFYLMQDLQLAWDLLRKEVSDSDEQVIDELTEKLEACREKHVRNSLLLNKQMEITRNLLNAITQKSADNASVYDKLGKLS